MADRVRGGLGAAAQPELGQYAAHVVLHGLAGEEQALGELAVGQALREQPQHLLLTVA